LSGRQGFASPSSCLAICGDESAKATDLDRAATKFRQRFDQIVIAFVATGSVLSKALTSRARVHLTRARSANNPKPDANLRAASGYRSWGQTHARRPSAIHATSSPFFRNEARHPRMRAAALVWIGSSIAALSFDCQLEALLGGAKTPDGARLRLRTRQAARKPFGYLRSSSAAVERRCAAL
jgi:hypothetical protein